MLQVGDAAPDFTMASNKVDEVVLMDLRGSVVVLYFYPKDDTPGCTKEACGFRDLYSEFEAKGAVVLGVSADSSASHTKFKAKYDLPFHLLADEEKQVIKQFGAWGEKRNRGKTYEGILRYTFVLDENNVVIKAYPKVKPEEHAAEILTIL